MSKLSEKLLAELSLAQVAELLKVDPDQVRKWTERRKEKKSRQWTLRACW